MWRVRLVAWIQYISISLNSIKSCYSTKNHILSQIFFISHPITSIIIQKHISQEISLLNPCCDMYHIGSFLYCLSPDGHHQPEWMTEWQFLYFIIFYQVIETTDMFCAQSCVNSRINKHFETRQHQSFVWKALDIRVMHLGWDLLELWEQENPHISATGAQNLENMRHHKIKIILAKSVLENQASFAETTMIP